MNEPQKILSTILIGNLFVNIIATSLSTQMITELFPVYGPLISTGIVTAVIVLFCEITPKIISFSISEVLAKKEYRMLSMFHWLFTPVRELIMIFTNLLMKIFHIRITDKNLTSDELGQAVRIGEEEGIINRDERVFIQNVLLFSKKEAANIMFPRNRAVFLWEDDTVQEAMQVFNRYDIVRAPVCRDDYDHVIGYLDSKDIISCCLGYRKEKKIKKFIQPVDFYPSTKELHELLNDLIDRGSQLAVLVDEYGGVDGVVTLNRILRELMGRGFKTGSGSLLGGEIKKISPVISVVSGEMQTSDFNFKFDESIAGEDSDSVGGYIIEKLGHFPRRGEIVETGNYTLKVRRIVRNRVASVEVIAGRGTSD